MFAKSLYTKKLPQINNQTARNFQSNNGYQKVGHNSQLTMDSQDGGAQREPDSIKHRDLILDYINNKCPVKLQIGITQSVLRNTMSFS